MNKVLARSFLLVASLLLFSCTEESKIKSAAREAAESRFQRGIRVEAEKIKGKDQIKENYITAILSRTEFEVDQIQHNGDVANVTVKINTVPVQVRMALMEVIIHHDKARDAALNVTDAMDLVYGRLGLKVEPSGVQSDRINLRKTDGWKINRTEL